MQYLRDLLKDIEGITKPIESGLADKVGEGETVIGLMSEDQQKAFTLRGTKSMEAHELIETWKATDDADQKKEIGLKLDNLSAECKLLDMIISADIYQMVGLDLKETLEIREGWQIVKMPERPRRRCPIHGDVDIIVVSGMPFPL